MKFEIFNDHFQNYKRYQIPKAQLVIADIPYNLGKKDFYKMAKEKMLREYEVSLFEI